jgi:hypothetical protein
MLNTSQNPDDRRAGRGLQAEILAAVSEICCCWTTPLSLK